MTVQIAFAGHTVELRRQDSFPGFCPIEEALNQLATAGGVEARGAIYTRLEVVEFMLDLAEFSVDRNLCELRLLEPSFGGGDFLLAAVRRILASWQEHKYKHDPVTVLRNCVRAVELHRSTFDSTRKLLLGLLELYGLSAEQAEELAQIWLINGDFLLTEIDGQFDVVIGNPPYVRQELIPNVLLAEYRNRYSTIFDRADLYIPFIEKSLYSLKPGGRLGFICSDRWMKNRYGGPLRKLIADKFHLAIYVDMVDTLAFQSDVIAYPAITIIVNEHNKTTRAAFRPQIESSALKRLAQELLGEEATTEITSVRVLADITSDSEPWILGYDAQLAVIRRLERSFPLLEEAGCKVGIGVATGADKAFIGPYEDLDVEDDRKLPLVTTKDIQGGTVEWRGLGVVNPFAAEGGLVNLGEYPKLRLYLEQRKAQIAGRHCAQKVPANWYRTIDRINPKIAHNPKLLIPDIKGKAHIVYEDGQLYPHHNLYFITSDEWDLRGLQAVMLSSITGLFISTYSTKMRGGFLRYQAQYLRRLRLPKWHDVPEGVRKKLIEAAQCLDIGKCNQATFELYGLTEEETKAIGTGA